MRPRRSLVALTVLALAAGACGADEAATVELPESPTALPDADFGSYTALLEHLRGTPVVVNIWASWCGPCQLEGPELADVSHEYEGRVQFLGIDVLDARPDAKRFIERYGWTYPSLFDRTGQIRDRLGLIGQPHTIFYDADGHEVDRHMGSITEDQLRERVASLVT